jgi:hypothetical protein
MMPTIPAIATMNATSRNLIPKLKDGRSAIALMEAGFGQSWESFLQKLEQSWAARTGVSDDNLLTTTDNFVIYGSSMSWGKNRENPWKSVRHGESTLWHGSG